ncbi:MAG: phosphodiester glycosidase family protein [Anaerolineae bacterium]|nr:phosphodiester glycosidase family protein [Anaerolineae bacterium]
MERSWSLLTAALMLAAAMGCGSIQLTSTGTPEPTLAPPPTWTPFPTVQVPQDTGWQEIDPGLETRTISTRTPQGKERIYIVRVDPLAYTLAVVYTPGLAQNISAWAAQTQALLTLNAGYFTEAYEVTGYTVCAGVPYGSQYGDFAGMLAERADGQISVRWLRTQPFVPGESLKTAVQSFPVLVKPGGVMGFPADADDGRVARRTLVAQDREGRLLFLIGSRGCFGLHALATWLTESDLDLHIALNLDGGTSTGLWLAGVVSHQIDSYTAVPAVITVNRR